MITNNILITGASGAIGSAVANILNSQDRCLGLHGKSRLPELSCAKNKNIYKFKSDLKNKEECYEMVDNFVDKAGGIKGLVQAHGNICKPCHWEKLTTENWNADLFDNLLNTFYIVQRSIYHMKSEGSGSIVLMSTASAPHGGGTDSLAYGVAKAGIDCITKRFAKDLGKYGIKVNAVAPGFIETEFHTKRMNRTLEQLSNRSKSIPLSRAGTANEVAKVMVSLLDDENFINGQIITIDGGDFI